MKSKFVRLAFALVLGLLLVMGGAVGCPSGTDGDGTGNGNGNGGGGTASFTVSNLTITPQNPGPGDTVTITATVTNSGTASGSYQVVLTINGSTESTQNVSLAAGASSGVNFQVTKNSAGTYQVAIGSLSGSFSVAATGESIIDGYFAAAGALTSMSFTSEAITSTTIPGFGSIVTTTQLEGQYDFTGRKYHFYTESVTTGAYTQKVTDDTYLIDEWIYYIATPPGVWYKIMLTPAELEDEWALNEPDSQENIDFLNLAQITLAGSEVVNGIDCNKLVLTIAAADFWAYIGGDGQVPAIGDLVYEIWIAKSNSYYIKDHISYSMTLEGVTSSIELTSFYSGHNQPVNIVLPAGAAGAIEI